MKLDEQLIEQIQEYNFGYLNLAKSMIAQDKEAAIVRLGVDKETADLIEKLTNAQIIKLCRSNQLIPRLNHLEKALVETAVSQNCNFIPHKIHSAIVLSNSGA